MVQVRVATRLVASLVLTVKLKVPAREGLPVMRPDDEATDKPGGNCPDVIDQKYGATPPVAASPAE
jgi:hypothetical protein